MNKKTYIIGHRNPDTDSVVSAASYAVLKEALGGKDFFAARAGKMTAQSEYIFNRFKVPVPEYLSDLLPKVGFYLNEAYQTVHENTSLWNAVAKMEECNSKVLSVIDSEGRYKSFLHYNAFAQNVLKILNPEKKTSVTTSIKLICDTLGAQPLHTKDENRISSSAILIAASQFDTFCEKFNEHLPENLIVITGDRADIQEYCIERGVKAIVLTAGSVLAKDLQAKATKNDVCALISPYDTSSTAMLIVYSTPVSAISDTDIKPVNKNDLVRSIKPILQNSPSRCLPVIDDEKKLIGIISESDLIQEANIEVIMVDHNELNQAIEGIEHYKIKEIIDHHRLGNLNTRDPITFINKPVGATSTLIATLFMENKVPMPKPIASILLAGILADTLILQSATTTDIDRDVAEYLSNITGLDIDELGSDIMSASSRIGKRSANDVIQQDMKEYTEGEHSFTVSQIEVDNPEEIMERKEEFLFALETEKKAKKLLFSALMVTDVTKLTSFLLISGNATFIQSITFPKQEQDMYVLKDIVSRKKQLIPLLSEQVEKY